MTLTEFLLARIAEDEAWANAAIGTPGATHWHWVSSDTDKPVVIDPFTQEAITEDGNVSLRTVEELKPVSWGGGDALPDFVIWTVDDMLSPGAAGHIARHDPARTLAECEAKRRIVEQQRESERVSESENGGAWSEGMAYAGELAMRALAMPYADHPDYREEWKTHA